MKPSTLFVLHFARLCSQLVHDPENQEATRALVDDLLAGHREAVTLIWDNWQLVVDGDVVPSSMPGVKDVLARMAAHSVREISFAGAVEPGHLLGSLWILAREPVIGDGGANALSRLAKLGQTGIRFIAVAAPASIPVMATPPTPEMAVSLEFELYEPELETPRSDGGAFETPTASTSRVEVHKPLAPIVKTPEALLARLKSLTHVDELADTLDHVASLINEARATQRVGDAADILTATMATESRFSQSEARHVFGMAIRRLATHQLLLAFAADLSRSRNRHAQYMALFARFGDDATEALIEQLVYAELAKERRVLFNAIVQQRRGVRTLIRMLGDGRWYVARNAAELLGEMRATEAESALIQGLRHEDPRVRRSSAAALAKLDTPGGMIALHEAMRDASPNVRMQALLGIAVRKEAQTSDILLSALDAEEDLEVRRALLIALGRHGTRASVSRLAAEAEPDTRLFRKKPMANRLAAVQGLAEARTPEARTALEMLTKDREREVREAAAKALAGGTPTPSRPQPGW